MIYRLSTGARHGWKKHVVSGLAVFAVTAGFPLLGAWLNFDRFFVSPAQVAQQQDGSVLGESTEIEPAEDDASNPDKAKSDKPKGAHAHQKMDVQPTPASQPLDVRPESQRLPNPVESPSPAAPTIPDSSTKETTDPALEVDILDVVEIEVEPSATEDLVSLPAD